MNNGIHVRSEVFLREDIEAILDGLSAARPDLEDVFDLVRIPFHIERRAIATRPTVLVSWDSEWKKITGGK